MLDHMLDNLLYSTTYHMLDSLLATRLYIPYSMFSEMGSGTLDLNGSQLGLGKLVAFGRSPRVE